MDLPERRFLSIANIGMVLAITASEKGSRWQSGAVPATVSSELGLKNATVPIGMGRLGPTIEL